MWPPFPAPTARRSRSSDRSPCRAELGPRDNIVADIDGKSRKPFHYHDKGIMAMIGKNAAVAEVGAKHHELHGPVAFAAWLGVHAWLMSGVRQRVNAFISWGWDYFGRNRAVAVLDRPDAARIDWDDDDEDAADADDLVG